MDSTKKENDLVKSVQPGSGTVVISGGTLHPGYGAVPPAHSNVTISSSSPWTSTATYTATAGTTPWATSKSGKLYLDDQDADIIINGKSLGAVIAKIEERLNILVPNSELETEWAELKQLGDKYRELEQQIKEKQATWDRLKAMPPPDID